MRESRLWLIFRVLLGRVPWEAAMKGKGAQESWLIFKENLLRAQDQTILLYRKTGNSGRRPAWLSQEILNELKHTKKGVYKEWKQREAMKEEYNNIARERLRTNAVGTKSGWSKQKVGLELKLARDTKGNKRCYRNISWKRKLREKVGQWMNEETV